MELFAAATRESSLYFNVAREFRLRVNETTDLEQRIAYSPRPEDLGDYLVHGEARSRNDFTFITGLSVTF